MVYTSYRILRCADFSLGPKNARYMRGMEYGMIVEHRDKLVAFFVRSLYILTGLQFQFLPFKCSFFLVKIKYGK